MARNKFPEETIKLILEVASKLFLKKGYDNTSLQDIIDETKLSKGAIYHHFESKEDIFISICERIGDENAVILANVRDKKNISGSEKLKTIFKVALTISNQSLVLNLATNLLENPRFLAMQIKQIYEIAAPKFIQPILQEGIDDGSIEIDHPAQVAEVIMLLMNIWLNPLVRPTNMKDMKDRCQVFNQLLSGLGIELMDDELMENFIHLTTTEK